MQAKNSDILNLRKKDLLFQQKKYFRLKVQNCKHNNIPFSVGFKDVVWSRTCPVLGIKLDYFADKKSDSSPSLCCIDPKLGYVPGNIRVISFRAARIKMFGTVEELRKLLTFLENQV